MEGYIGFENYKDNKLRLEVGRVYTRRPVIAGTHSIAVSTGDESEAIVSGDQSVAISIGWRSKAKGALGCWLVLAECRSKKVIDVKSTQVDGDRIKVNTFYRLKNGEFVECKGM